MIRTDRGHEFQAKFYWHVEDRGVRHAYIKPRSPQLNGRSSARTAQIRKSSISFSVTKMTSTSKPNWRTGSASIISQDLMALTTERPPTKLSEIAYDPLQRVSTIVKFTLIETIGLTAECGPSKKLLNEDAS